MVGFVFSCNKDNARHARECSAQFLVLLPFLLSATAISLVCSFVSDVLDLVSASESGSVIVWLEMFVMGDSE